MKNYAFGIDVGGTTVKMGLFTTAGEIINKWEIPTNTADGGVHILDDIEKAIRDELASRNISMDDVEGVGIGIPGPVDKDGVVNKCVNLGWGVTPLREKMEAKLGVKVRVGNDANVAALGECWMGGGKGFNDIVMLTLGTGVGGGVVIDGKLVVGVGGSAGEIGHIKVDYEETESCNCGGKGCLEYYASATGIARMAKRMRPAFTGVTSLDATEGIAKDVFDGAKAGDEFCLSVADKVCNILGKAIANLASVTDPGAFVIGGGVSKAGPILTDAVEKYYKQYAFHACSSAKIVIATLGNDAGMYGCVKLLLD